MVQTVNPKKFYRSLHRHESLAECLKDMLDFKQIELCGTEIIEMLKTVSGKQAKSQFYNAIIRKWKRESGLPIYHKISPHFNELRELTKNE